MMDVSCALIMHQSGQILVTQRSSTMRLPLKWEFPGGKVEEGETAEECIVREVEEELGIKIKVVSKRKAYTHDDGKQPIQLIPFYCKMLSGEINLTEHAAYQWLYPAELINLDWAEADLPILKDYLDGI